MHFHRRSTRALAVTTALLLSVMAAAPAPQAATLPLRQDLRSPDARDIAEGRPSPEEIIAIVRLVPDRNAVAQPAGFHVRDAAVGALAATGLILLVAGTVLIHRRRAGAEPFIVVIQRSL